MKGGGWSCSSGAVLLTCRFWPGLSILFSRVLGRETGDPRGWVGLKGDYAAAGSFAHFCVDLF